MLTTLSSQGVLNVLADMGVLKGYHEKHKTAAISTNIPNTKDVEVKIKQTTLNVVHMQDDFV